jgi:hypothetical protein
MEHGVLKREKRERREMREKDSGILKQLAAGRRQRTDDSKLNRQFVE